MKTLLILCFLFGSSFSIARDGGQDAPEVCIGGFVVLPDVHLRDFHGALQMSCKSFLETEEYMSCLQRPEWHGGPITIQCDQGRYSGCCYRRSNGNPHAGLRLIRCDSIDTRGAWQAFKEDVLRRRPSGNK